MATVKNNWVGFLDRSYQQIKTSLLSRLTISNPEMTDHSESNPFIILVSMFAGVAEMLGFYIDNSAKESFIATADRRTSVIKHSTGLDYRIKAASPESVNIHIVWSFAVPSDFTIFAGSFIDSNDGIRFTTTNDFVVTTGSIFSNVPFSQIDEIANANFGITDGTDYQRFSLGTVYVHKSLVLTIDGLDYTEVDSFASAGPTDRVFIVDIDPDGNAYFKLGDGVKGFKPNAGLTVAVTYFETDGESGKVISGGFDFNTLTLVATLPGGLTVSSANSQVNSSGGSLYENTESIRRNAIYNIRTQNRMTTWDDHYNVPATVAGVAKVGVNFCCGKTIDIYIVPEGGGLASSELINQVQDVAEDTKSICTFPVVKAAGETGLVIYADVTAKKRKSITETRDQVEEALVEFGNVENQDINGSIRLSDIQALIDNLSNVEFVELTAMYTKPYARPIVNNSVLIWTNETLQASVSKVNWRLEYDGSSFRVFRDEVFKGNISVGNTYVAEDSIFKFTIQASTYNNGDSWSFTTQPYLGNLILTDFTIFTVNEADINLTVRNQPNTNRNSVC